MDSDEIDCWEDEPDAHALNYECTIFTARL